MPHWRSMLDSKYVFAYDLDGKERTLTISRVEGGELEGDKGRKTKKPLVYFKESKTGKPLALNATNGKTIERMYGGDVDGWIGKRVTLYPTTCEMAGETRDCIRIRPRAPTAQRQQTAPAEAPPTDRPDVSDAGDPEPPEPGSDG